MLPVFCSFVCYCCSDVNTFSRVLLADDIKLVAGGKDCKLHMRDCNIKQLQDCFKIQRHIPNTADFSGAPVQI